ncbi:MAG: arginine--tRNA ligase [Thermoplasmata archaeon]
MAETASPDPGGALSSDPWEPLRGRIIAALARALSSRGADSELAGVASQLEGPAQPPADLAVALQRPARRAGRPADGLARDLAGELEGMEGFRRVFATGPYLNFEADPDVLGRATLEGVFDRGERYGHGPARPGAVSVEHTSANTTGPFHIGRVRNAILGDTVARVLRAAGHPVTTQYYVDDVGRQAAIITWIWSTAAARWAPEISAALPAGWEHRAPEQKTDHYRGAPYPWAAAFLKEHPGAAEEVQAIARELERGRSPPRHHELAREILEGMLESLGRLGIRFNEFVWESSLLTDGSVDEVRARLLRAPHAVREDNGAEAIDAASYGLPTESARIIVARADGTSLYATRDVAFHLKKFQAFDRVLDVLGADHRLHARTLEALLAEIGEPRRPEFLLYAYVTAPGGGKMSSRGGTAVYLDDLLEEAVRRALEEVRGRHPELPPEEAARIAERIGCGAVRYSIVRVAAEKTVQFGWEEALSFEGRSAPFLQYSYARASSLLRKAERTEPPYPYRIEELAGPEERTLLNSISRLPGTVAYVARTGHVHALAGYAHGLAEEFNRFYHEVPVLRAGADRESRVALVAAGRQALGNTLELLGIERLERM